MGEGSSRQALLPCEGKVSSWAVEEDKRAFSFSGLVLFIGGGVDFPLSPKQHSYILEVPHLHL